jgi:hypothetical protein
VGISLNWVEPASTGFYKESNVEVFTDHPDASFKQHCCWRIGRLIV